MIFYAQRREQALMKKFINQVAIEIIESRKEKARLLDKEVEEIIERKISQLQRIENEFYVYRGIALPPLTIDQWSN